MNPIAKQGNRPFNDDVEHIYDPIHVEELESSDHDPFHEEESRPHRWLITTCIAGVAGSLVIGAAILGLFSDNATSTALASVNITEPWQKPNVSAKSDLNGAFAKTLEMRPLYTASVAYQPGSNTSVISNNVILPQNGSGYSVSSQSSTTFL
ncbi:MAG TPA: hypothetical protein ENJ55_03450, partial [Rhizobiales bacterium]|nr:hypothetical protein [Hyphomicrobiales bacterium]